MYFNRKQNYSGCHYTDLLWGCILVSEFMHKHWKLGLWHQMAFIASLSQFQIALQNHILLDKPTSSYRLYKIDFLLSLPTSSWGDGIAYLPAPSQNLASAVFFLRLPDNLIREQCSSKCYFLNVDNKEADLWIPKLHLSSYLTLLNICEPLIAVFICVFLVSWVASFFFSFLFFTFMF